MRDSTPASSVPSTGQVAHFDAVEVHRSPGRDDVVFDVWSLGRQLIGVDGDLLVQARPDFAQDEAGGNPQDRHGRGCHQEAGRGAGGWPNGYQQQQRGEHERDAGHDGVGWIDGVDVRGAGAVDEPAARVDQLPVVQPVRAGDQHQKDRAEHCHVAYARREQRVVAQVSLAGDEGKRPRRRADRRLDRRQTQRVDERHREDDDDRQSGEPAARRHQRWQRPDVEGDVLTEGGVGLSEWPLGLQPEPGLPLAERGQTEAKSDDQGDERDRRDDRGHAA